MKKLILLSSLLLLFSGLQAQNPVVIFEETFDGDLGSFTAGSGIPEGATWQFAPLGLADTIIIDGQKVGASFYGSSGPIDSPTADNGAAQFNSDAYDNGGNPDDFGNGPFPAPQTANLTSPVIDCSNFSNVALEFYQYGRMLLDDATLVEVSSDGGLSWEQFRPNDRIFSNEVNASTGPRSRIVIDISDIAANAAEVQVRFVWSDGFYYFWLIDDVRVLGNVENNLSITDFFYPLSSFATPASQIATDTFGFSARVANLGTLDQTNVRLRATVFSPSEDLFTDSITLNLLPAGEDTLLIIPMTFAPELDQGPYGILYETFPADNPDTDFYPEDNNDGEVFVVTDTIFSKEDGFLGDDTEWPSGFNIEGDYQMGNVYSMSPLSGNGYAATEATFTVFKPESAGPIAGNVATILLYRVKDRVDPNFGNFNINSTGGPDEDDDLVLVGFGSHTFTEDHDAFEDIDVALESFDDPGAPIFLDPGARYFLVADYQNTSNGIIHLISDDINYASGLVSSLVFSDGAWGGLGRGNQPIMRMKVELMTDTDEVPLPETAMTLFPNPASDQVQLQLDLENAGDALITIADISGRILQMRQFDNVQRETLRFDVSNYPAGTYLIRVGTADGTRTEKFVISR